MIRMTNVVYTAGKFTMNFSLEIKAGEYLVIMGPTGAGKTVAVECLAGLRRPASGRIEIAGQDVTRAEPRDRAIGYVPQDYALFGNRSVWGNIAFGPEVRGVANSGIRAAVESAARLAGITALLDRRVQGLSGGERQRVALARALAVNPKVLILDEPVSAIDEYMRETVCAELRRVQRETGITTIHVSHNLEEAFMVADRTAILCNGQLEQVGATRELLRRPRNLFVARFMRCENFFGGEAIGPGSRSGFTRIRTAGPDFEVPGQWSGALMCVVRPENFRLTAPNSPPPAKGAIAISACIGRVIDRGAYIRVELKAFQPFVVNLPLAAFTPLPTSEAGELLAWVNPADIHVVAK